MYEIDPNLKIIQQGPKEYISRLWNKFWNMPSPNKWPLVKNKGLKISKYCLYKKKIIHIIYIERPLIWNQLVYNVDMALGRCFDNFIIILMISYPNETFVDKL